jgi:hypothetical protein
MTAISKQFHALPSEFPDLLEGLLTDQSIFIVAVEKVGGSKQFKLLNPDHKYNSSAVEALIFTLKSPVLGAKNVYDFVGMNPDALIVEIGKYADGKLHESGFSTKTSNESALKRWRKAARQLCKLSKGGGRAVNPETGASAPALWMRHTPGAEEAFHQGVVLQAIGACVISLEPKTND